MRLGCATFVTLKFILNQDLRFVRIMPITPPAKHRAGPDGLTTMPFWLGLYLPRMIGLSLTMIIRTGEHRFCLPVVAGKVLQTERVAQRESDQLARLAVR